MKIYDLIPTDGWSATTGRHIAAFCGMGKAEYIKLPVMG